MKYIVDFHNDAPDAEISKYLLDNGCTVLKEWNNFDKVYLVEAASEPPASAIVAHVVDDSNTLAIKPLDYVEINRHFLQPNNPNYPTVTISTTSQQDWYKNYSLQNPVFDEPTTTYSQKGSNVHVYIMDSGIDATHPEFQGVSITNLYSVAPGDFTDTTGHGTALASVIAGKTCGVSSAKLKIVKIFQQGVSTLQSQFLDALDAVLADMPANGFAVLNCSWSIPRNAWVEFKLKECIDEGIWVLAAAGNNGTAIGDVTPAAMPEAFTVGAYDQNLQPCDFTDYTGTSGISITQGPTNTGALDGWAPGTAIWSAMIPGPNAGSNPPPEAYYGYHGGTSMATAIASGIAAFNLSDLLDSNGTRIAGTEMYQPNMGTISGNALIVSRPGLLDLSAPQYANSKNLVATLKQQQIALQPPDELIGTLRAGSEGVACRPFSPHVTKSFELLDTLPANFVCTHEGAIYGRPTLEQGPTDGSSFVLHTVRAKRIDENDLEEIVKIDLYILASNFQPSDLPPDHPIVITFSTSCQGAGNFSCGLNYHPNCTNACSPGASCCDSGKAQMCNCIA